MLKTVSSFLSKVLFAFEYLVAPPVCYACRCFMYERAILCSNCDAKIMPIAPKILKVTSKYMMSVHAIARYDDPLKSLLLAKHRSDHIVIHGLADLVWKKTVTPLLQVDCFVPIPLHWSRRMKRGFNQAAIIAQRLADRKGVVMCDMLQRVKKTEYQARLEQSDREDNVKNAFSIQSGHMDIAGKHVVLVDDLCTTGSTALSAAKVLAKTKPASLTLVVACRSK